MVELGLKSEGILDKGEFDEPTNVKVETRSRSCSRTSRGHRSGEDQQARADRIINWEKIMKSKKEGDPVRGKVTKKIKGGLLVDIGVPVFLRPRRWTSAAPARSPTGSAATSTP